MVLYACANMTANVMKHACMLPQNYVRMCDMAHMHAPH